MSTLVRGASVVAMDESLAARVLSEIAETASETLELREVFGRVATSIRRIIPFDNMGVVRIVGDSHAVLHASTFPCHDGESDCTDPIPLTFWSPRMRPRPGPNPRIDDGPLELDPSFHVDAQALRGGVRSGMWEPFRPLEAFRGGVWLSSYRPHAFTEEHQEMLRPIAALLGTAVEHWRIWDADRRRRDRLDRVDTLLGTIAESLDVREVFPRLSQGMKPILAHEMMVLTELDMRLRTIRILAAEGACNIPPPTEAVPLTEREIERRLESEIINDIQVEVAPETDRQRLILSSGLRSWLRVPVWISGEVKGGLNFFHRDPSRYGPEDAEVARRLADRIALVLSHQQLAMEARVAAETREKAERLEATVQALARELESRGRAPIIGNSSSWKETLLAVGRVAPSGTTVLITGESGTGKEVIAGLVHQQSPRAGKPFVAINCAALPEQLLESELFGHEKGAFTGAVATKIGRIEQAEGGTLFLDEIGEMSPLVQAKFLRFLQEREFERVGGSKVIKADVRVIAATNRDLGAAIARRTFREDLYYRLNVFQIDIAPLRERQEDILPLAQSFLEELGGRMGRPAAGISRDAAEWLLAYPWPGNVRELRNAIERAILLCDGGLITTQHLPAVVTRGEAASAVAKTNGGAHANGAAGMDGGGAGAKGAAGMVAAGNGAEPPLTLDLPAPPPAGGYLLQAVERGYIERALEQAKGNKSKAARLLGLTRAQLYSRLEKYRM